MPKQSFERLVTKYEFENKCVLLQDNKHKDFSKDLKSHKLRVNCGDKHYDGIVNDFYTKNGFMSGIVFDDHGAGLHSFFFEQGVMADRTLKIDFDPTEIVEGDRHILSIEVVIITKK